MKTTSKAGRATHTGGALIISLILLLMLTIMGISAMRTGTLQERMTGNARDMNAAFQAGEAAVRDAERVLSDPLNLPGAFTGSNGLYMNDQADCNPDDGSVFAGAPPDWAVRASEGWTKRTAPGSGDDNITLAAVSEQPEYVILRMPVRAVHGRQDSPSLEAGQELPCIDLYAITSRGYGTSSNSMVVLQTIYRRERL